MKLVLILLVLVPAVSCCKQLVNPVDCSDIQNQNKRLKSGVYTIYPLGERSAVKVYCDLRTQGGRWTLLQTRMDGTVNFYRPWDQYKMGFGNAAGEHWLGLDVVHYLTRRQKYELLVEMEDFNGKKASASYSIFNVAGECEGYKLTVGGFKNGGAGDALMFHNGMKFSTFDRDQDTYSGNCAKQFLGAFWYKNCHNTNPNAIYRWGLDGTINYICVSWKQFRGHNYSLKTFSMKLRPLL